MFPKILLLTPTRPGEGSVGEIFLRDVCLQIPKDKLVCFAISSDGYGLGVDSPELGWLQVAARAMPPERMIIGRFGTKTFSGGRITRKRAINIIADEVLNYCKANQVELIFSILAGPTMVEITDTVMARTNLRLVTLVWDPIEYLMDELNFDRNSANRILKAFERVQKRALSCAVASDAMGREYQSLYGVRTTVLMNGAPSPQIDKVTRLSRNDEFVIAFAGTLYAAYEFNSLISALSSKDFRIGGRDIRLILMGNIFGVPISISGKRANIEILGFRPQQEVVNILAGADAGYLPYWMQEKYARAVRLCFPNKITQYIAAKIPVFFHGPVQSAPVEFMNRYPIGLSCHSLKITDILSTLNELVLDPHLKARAQEACNCAIDKEINKHHFNGQLAKILETDLATTKSTN